jgi:hypothetical protein
LQLLTSSNVETLSVGRGLLEILVHLLDHRLPQSNTRVDEPVGDLAMQNQQMVCFSVNLVSETVCLYLAPAQPAPRRQHLLLVVFRVPESDTGLPFSFRP